MNQQKKLIFQIIILFQKTVNLVQMKKKKKLIVKLNLINFFFNIKFIFNIFFLDEQENFLKVIMTQMKRKLEFIEKTNWMFQSNFDIHFLESIDPKLIEDNQNYIYIDPQ